MWSERAPPDYLSLTLRSRVYDYARETPYEFMPQLSERVGGMCHVKREDILPGFSTVVRGVYNRLQNLPEEDKSKGVVCYSIGSHAASVALAAKELLIDATVVMPLTTSFNQVEAVRRTGAKVVMHGNRSEDARVKALEIAEGSGLVYIQAHGHPHNIAGQGTIGMEIVNQHRGQELDAIFCPVGGGDTLAGVAAFVKKVAPEIQVIGVEPHGANTMEQSLRACHRLELQIDSSFAEGATVSQVAEEPFRVCDELVDDIVVVTNDEICASIKQCFDDTRSMLEPSGALAVAGMTKYAQINPGGSYAAIMSEANIKFDTLRYVAERALIGQRHEALLSVQCPEEPGSFKRLYDIIYPRAVTEFSYRYGDPSTANIYVGISLENASGAEAEVSKVVSDLNQESNFKAMDISNNDMAKDHARYLAGGRRSTTTGSSEERLLRFQFPEKPGALKTFLETLPASWNVSLFHYRNHGYSVGKVLTALEIPKQESGSIDEFLDTLGYRYTDETANEVYKNFLR